MMGPTVIAASTADAATATRTPATRTMLERMGASLVVGDTSSTELVRSRICVSVRVLTLRRSPKSDPEGLMKGQQKPKKLAKKAPQKSLKEQRAAKAAKKKARS
jgi:hypothetical protein